MIPNVPIFGYGSLFIISGLVWADFLLAIYFLWLRMIEGNRKIGFLVLTILICVYYFKVTGV